MNLTIHIGIWIIPTIISLVALSFVFVAAYKERNDSGIFSGMMTAASLLVAMGIIVAVWTMHLVYTLTK